MTFGPQNRVPALQGCQPLNYASQESGSPGPKPLEPAFQEVTPPSQKTLHRFVKKPTLHRKPNRPQPEFQEVAFPKEEPLDCPFDPFLDHQVPCKANRPQQEFQEAAFPEEGPFDFTFLPRSLLEEFQEESFPKRSPVPPSGLQSTGQNTGIFVSNS